MITIVPRVVAWVFITSMTVVNYYSYMQGLIWHSGFGFIRMGLNDFVVTLGFMLFFWLAGSDAFFCGAKVP